MAAQISGTAHDLHCLTGVFLKIGGAVKFQFGNFRQRALAAIHNLSHLVEIGIHCVNIGRHISQLMAYHLMRNQLVAKGLAVLRVSDTFIKQAHRHAGHLRCHPKTLIIEIIHNGVKALIFFAHQMVGRHTAIVKIQRCRVRCPPAHFALNRRAGETGRVGIDKK